MLKSRKMDRKTKLFIINNLIIFLFTAVAVPVTLMVGSRTTRLDNSPYPYWMHIVSFTLLSGIFMGLVAGISAFIVLYARLQNVSIPGKRAMQKWYLAASTASMITCLTVLFFLAPMRVARGGNYFDPLLETMFFLHFFNPIFSAITYALTADRIKTTPKICLLAALPFIVYSIIYVLCVIVFKVWPDFYGLTFGGKYYLTPIVFVIFIALSCGITSGLIKLRNVLQK